MLTGIQTWMYRAAGGLINEPQIMNAAAADCFTKLFRHPRWSRGDDYDTDEGCRTCIGDGSI